MGIDYYILQFAPYGFLGITVILGGILVHASGRTEESARDKLDKEIQKYAGFHAGKQINIKGDR